MWLHLNWLVIILTCHLLPTIRNKTQEEKLSSNKPRQRHIWTLVYTMCATLASRTMFYANTVFKTWSQEHLSLECVPTDHTSIQPKESYSQSLNTTTSVSECVMSSYVLTWSQKYTPGTRTSLCASKQSSYHHLLRTRRNKTITKS